MGKLFGDKMSYFQWQDAMEMRYDTMPLWWHNMGKRRQAYKNYLEGKSYG